MIPRLRVTPSVALYWMHDSQVADVGVGRLSVRLLSVQPSKLFTVIRLTADDDDEIVACPVP